MLRIPFVGMTRVLPGAVFFLGLVFLGTNMAWAGAPPVTQSPEVGEGREVFGQACVQCHGPGHTALQRKSKDGWRDTVFSMIARGAPVLPDEIEPLTVYLSATFGPDSMPGGGQGGSVTPPADFGDDSGRALLEERCAGCHSLEQVTEARKTEAEWKETINQMLSFGAQLTPEEQRTIEAYTSRNFGSE